MDFQFGTSFNSESNFTTQRIGDANFPNYMDSSVPLYTPASHVSLSEQFEPPVYSTMTSSDADNNVDEMAPVVESIAEDVDEPLVQGCNQGSVEPLVQGCNQGSPGYASTSV